MGNSLTHYLQRVSMFLEEPHARNYRTVLCHSENTVTTCVSKGCLQLQGWHVGVTCHSNQNGMRGVRQYGKRESAHDFDDTLELININ